MGRRLTAAVLCLLGIGVSVWGARVITGALAAAFGVTGALALFRRR